MNFDSENFRNFVSKMGFLIFNAPTSEDYNFCASHQNHMNHILKLKYKLIFLFGTVFEQFCNVEQKLGHVKKIFSILVPMNFDTENFRNFVSKIVFLIFNAPASEDCNFCASHQDHMNHILKLKYNLISFI